MALLLGALAAPASASELQLAEPLSTIGQVRGLSPEEARKRRPVRLKAVVTYYHHDWEMLFVEDATGGVYVYVDRRRPPLPIRVGQLVELRGRTVPGDFIPSIAEPQVEPLETPGVPVPRPATLDEIATGAEDARWIEVEGIVRSARLVDDLLALTLMMEGGRLLVHVQDWDGSPDFGTLVDTRVRVRGVCTTLANDQRQFTGAELWSPHLRYVVVEEPAPDAFSLPAVPIEGLRRLSFAGRHDRRLKVTGSATLQVPQRGVFIQDGPDGLLVETTQELVVQPGERVEAAGFLAEGDFRPVLEDAVLRVAGGGEVPTPAGVGAKEAAQGAHGARLVRVRGRFVGRVASDGKDALVIEDGETVFDARMSDGALPDELGSIEPGSLVEVTGVCAVTRPASSGPALQVLLRSAADLMVLERPSWWTAGRVRRAAQLTSGILMAVLVWVVMLRRRVGQQTAIIRERLEREAALERRYRELVENANDLVFSLDHEGRVTSINRAVERILGYAAQEVLGRRLWDPSVVGEFGVEPTGGGISSPREAEVAARDGGTRVLEVSARPRLIAGVVVGVEGIARDVTERKRTEAELRRQEEALRESRERFALAVQGTNDGVWDWDLRKDRVYLSPRWKAMLGYVDAEVGETPEDWFRLVHDEDREGLVAKLESHRNGSIPHFEAEHRMRHKDGSYRWVLSRGFALRDAEGRAYRMAGAQTDVTDRRSYDVLTSLPNRALFVERLEKAVLRSRHDLDHLFAVLFLDLDRFKIVNDSLGHLEGDCLLVTMAQRLEACVRPGDMVARFGGDEFAILVDGIAGVGDAARVAERIQKALAPAFKLGVHEVYTSASIGIALSSTGYQRAEDLLRDADTAMYRAKGAGRARFEVFDAAMRAQVTAILETENDLRRALERHEFRVHYQPIVALAGESVVAWEALVRWQHPVRGLLAPKDFIGVAEETGLVVAMGDDVLRQACVQMRVWQEKHAAFRGASLCVNVSSRQFSDPELVRRIEDALRLSRLDALSLVLEITESAIMENAEAAMDRIARLRELGVRFHVDDFGTGYSSLSYLHRFPIDALKIDRSFVAALTRNEDAAAIVGTVLSLARSLKLAVIAEGVETPEQAARLREMGCELAQGHYFSFAVDVAAAEALVTAIGTEGALAKAGSTTGHPAEGGPESVALRG